MLHSIGVKCHFQSKIIFLQKTHLKFHLCYKTFLPISCCVGQFKPMTNTSGACTIKLNESVIYRKMTNFLLSQYLLPWTSTLVWTNKQASLIWSLYITDPLSFIVQAPGCCESASYQSTYSSFLDWKYQTHDYQLSCFTGRKL